MILVVILVQKMMGNEWWKRKMPSYYVCISANSTDQYR